MKQGMTANLPVMFDIPLNTVEMVEFVFKQYVSCRAPALKYSVYKADGSGDAFLGEDNKNQIIIPWTAEETCLFIPDAQFYMDTRITVTEGTEHVQTSITPLRMNQSLFTVPADIQPGDPGWSDIMYDDSEIRNIISNMTEVLTGIKDNVDEMSEKTNVLWGSYNADSPQVEKNAEGILVPQENATPRCIKTIYGRSVQSSSEISNIEVLRINYVGKNLFTRQVEYTGKQITSDGQIVDSSRFVITSRLPIIPGQEHLYVSSDIWTPTGIRICFYDSDDVFINCNAVNFYSDVDIPENADYVRFCYISDEYSDAATMIEYGTGASMYEPGIVHSYAYILSRPLNGTSEIKDTFTAEGYTFNFKNPLDEALSLEDQMLEVPEELPADEEAENIFTIVKDMPRSYTFFITDQGGTPVAYTVEYLKNNQYVRDVRANGLSVVSDGVAMLPEIDYDLLAEKVAAILSSGQ